MTILTIDKKEFERKVGKLTKELGEKISMFGTPSDQWSQVVGDGSLSLIGDRMSVARFIRACRGVGR